VSFVHAISDEQLDKNVLYPVVVLQVAQTIGVADPVKHFGFVKPVADVHPVFEHGCVPNPYS
jgi:hypothetical protein